MNPVAFTYDWGMVTDLARRNQARVCGKLGVEHIIRSADITAKRRYVRKNVEAWLKKPELGMVTLFMAGDKEFYAHARQLRKETGHQARHLLHRQHDRGRAVQDRPHGRPAGRPRQHAHRHVAPQQDRHAVVLREELREEPARTSTSRCSTRRTRSGRRSWSRTTSSTSTTTCRGTRTTIVGTIRREYDWEIATDTDDDVAHRRRHRARSTTTSTRRSRASPRTR